MPTKINADTTLGGAIITGDSSGNLELQSAGVTKLTVASSGVTLASALPIASGGTNSTATPTAGAVPYGTGTALAYTSVGTSGQFLTSAGAGTPTWSTVTVAGSGGATASGNVTLTSASSGAQSITTTTFGQTVTLPDATTMTKAACTFNIRNAGGYPLRVVDAAGTLYGYIYPQNDATVGLADNSTSAGVWTISGLEPVALTGQVFFGSSIASTTSFSYLSSATLDTTRTIFTFSPTGASQTYAVVYDSSTNTCGSLVLLSAGGAYAQAYAISSSSALVTYNQSSVLSARVLSISGTTITANTQYTSAGSQIGGYGSSATVSPILLVGSTYVLKFYDNGGSVNKVIGMTVSGTVITFGTAVQLSGNLTSCLGILPNTASSFVTFSNNGSTLYIDPFTVSGTTLTIGTTTGQNIGGPSYRVVPATTSGRYWALYTNASLTLNVSLATVAANNVTFSTSSGLFGGTAFSSTDPVNKAGIGVLGNKLVLGIADNTNMYVNILTDSSGTISTGTAVTTSLGVGTTQLVLHNLTGNTANFAQNQNSQITQYVVDASGASPTLSRIQTINLGSGGTSLPNASVYDGGVASYQYSNSTSYYVPPVTTASRGMVLNNGNMYVKPYMFQIPVTLCVLRMSSSKYVIGDTTYASVFTLNIIESAGI